MSTVGEVIHGNLESLASTLPGVRDGEKDAIHQARVATRRLRAALPLLSGRGASAVREEAATALRTLGRALGRARDVDEAISLLEEIEGRSPASAPATAVLRARLQPQQLKQRRRLIKTIEALELEGLHRLRSALPHEGNGSRFHLWRDPVTASRLVALMQTSADRAARKVQHASGVYFPNRAHGARVAIKKLRYAAELMDPREPLRKPSIRALRKAQEVLGHVHDREVLLARLNDVGADHDVPAASILAGVLEAESRALFASYRGMREDVLAATAGLAEWAARHRQRTRGPLLMLGAVALPSAAALLVRRARRAG